jgi:hypothetical protein
VLIAEEKEGAVFWVLVRPMDFVSNAGKCGVVIVGMELLSVQNAQFVVAN